MINYYPKEHEHHISIYSNTQYLAQVTRGGRKLVNTAHTKNA